MVISKVLHQLRVFTAESFSVRELVSHYAISHFINHVLFHVQPATGGIFSLSDSFFFSFPF